MKGPLTNERLRKTFKKNNFELVHTAISVGYGEIKSGHEISLSTILELVRKHGIDVAEKCGL